MIRKTLAKVIGASVFNGALLATFELAAQDAGGALDPTQKETIFSLLMKGGPIMIPLGICSVIAVTVALERLLSLRVNNVVPIDFFKSLKRIQDEGKEGALDKIVEYCDKNSSPIGRIVKAAILKYKGHHDKHTIEKVFEDHAGREVGRMHRSLRALKVVAAVSPLLGLLGTVFGMIRAFQTVALSTDSFGKAEKLAHGIYEAMVTTATGLTIAIPTLLVFYFLSHKVDKLTDDVEVACDQFMNDFLID